MRCINVFDVFFVLIDNVTESCDRVLGDAWDINRSMIEAEMSSFSSITKPVLIA